MQKNLCREVSRLLQRSGESSAEKSGDFSAGVMRFLVLLYEAEQQDDELSRKDAQEHAEGVDCAVAYCGRVACGRLVGKCECRGVGVAAGYQSHQGEVVRLVAESCYESDYQNGEYCYEEAAPDVGQAIACDDGIDETCACLDTDAGKEEGKAYLTKHEVGTRGGIGYEFGTISEASDEDGYDEGAACQTEFDGCGDAWKCYGYCTEDDTDKDADEDGREVGMLEFLDAVAHHTCHTIYCIFGAYHHDAVAYLHSEAVVGKKVHIASANACDIDAMD